METVVCVHGHALCIHDLIIEVNIVRNDPSHIVQLYYSNGLTII